MRRALAFAVIGLAAALQTQAQPPPPTPQQQLLQPQEPYPPGFAKFGPLEPPAPPAKAPVNSGTPLFGQTLPTVGPHPPSAIGPPSRCPIGYVEPSNAIKVAHLIVCIVAVQPNVTGYNEVARPNLAIAQAAQSIAPPVSTTVPGQVDAMVSHCAGRPQGSYACGRGGTECCLPNQDNMCFAGAYACRVSPSAQGPKNACCMSK